MEEWTKEDYDRYLATGRQPVRTDTKIQSRGKQGGNPRVKNARVVEAGNIRFASKLEKHFYDRLVFYSIPFYFQRRVMLQPGFDFEGRRVRPIHMVPDFYFDWEYSVYDTKGWATDVAKLKWKMFRYRHRGTSMRVVHIKDVEEADRELILLLARWRTWLNHNAGDYRDRYEGLHPHLNIEG